MPSAATPPATWARGRSPGSRARRSRVHEDRPRREPAGAVSTPTSSRGAGDGRAWRSATWSRWLHRNREGRGRGSAVGLEDALEARLVDLGLDAVDGVAGSQLPSRCSTEPRAILLRRWGREKLLRFFSFPAL